MCGIFGWVPSENRRSDDMDAVARNLFAALRNRGPDNRGYSAFGPGGHLLGTDRNSIGLAKNDCAVLLGQTRLSIIDLSDAGRQPMSTSDGLFHIVFNGEIYNYLELRAELESRGIKFRTKTDTEVLLHALAAWGEKALFRLNGMFAFAFYDSARGRILCARDFFGIKPFYWTTCGKDQDIGFAFASELPALLRFPGISRKLDWTQAYNYLAWSRVDAGTETMIRGVRQLPAGQLLEVDAASGRVLREERYWKVPLPEPARISFDDAAREARRLFLDSVRLHLRSDVPLGVALSGGIDSSALACAVRHVAPDLPLNTFSYIADDGKEISEESWVDKVNAFTGAKSHKVFIRAKEMAEDIDTLILRLGEPFNSTSIYAQYRVFKLVRDSGVVVSLDGQGADEMLAGYFGYPTYRAQTLAGRRRYIRLLKFVMNTARDPGSGRDWKTLLGYALGLDKLAKRCPVSIKNLLRGNPVCDGLHMAAIREAGADIPPPQSSGLYSSPDKVREELAENLTWNGLPNLLRHGDRNSMTFSVESRVPFCNRQLSEFLLSLPENYLIGDDGLTKRVFRTAMRGIVPDEILDRKDKIGFATPDFKWLSILSPWVEESLALAMDSKLVRHDAALAEWRAVSSGAKPFDWRIWRKINYLRWRELLSVGE